MPRHIPHEQRHTGYPARPRAVALLLIVAVIAGWAGDLGSTFTEKAFAVGGPDGVIDAEIALFDDTTSADGNGPLRVRTRKSTTVKLYEARDLEVDGGRRVFRASMRTQKMVGKAYPEMRVLLAGGEERIARGDRSVLSGDSDWTKVETFVDLASGEMPKSVVLVVSIEGRGGVWVDEVSLTREPVSQS